MVKKNKDEVIDPAATEIPSFIAQGEDAPGMGEKLNLRASTPRLYITQAQTKNKELRQEHGIGALLLGLGDNEYLPVASVDETVVAAPLCRWLSWAKHKDKDDAGEGFWIIDETTDPASDICTRASNRDLWFEPYPDGTTNAKGEILQYRYVENINFLFAILDGPAKGQVVAYSWAKGGWKYGRKLNGYLERRKVAIFGNRVHLVVREAENPKGENWMQIQHEVASPPFVDEAQYAELAEVHKVVEDMRATLGAVKVDEQQS